MNRASAISQHLDRVSAVVTFAMAGFSVTYFLLAVFGVIDPVLTFNDNSLAEPVRRNACLFLALGTLGISLFLYAWCCYATVPVVAALSNAAAKARIVLPLFFLPFIFDIRVFPSDPVFLFFLSLLCAWWFALTLRKVSVPHLSGARLAKVGPCILLTCAIALYILFVSKQTLWHFYSLNMGVADMGIKVNALWNSAHGRFMYCSILDGSLLKFHTSYIFLLLVPFTYIWSTPTVLLVSQALLVGLAAWPLYLLAVHHLESRWLALLVSVMYLVQPAIDTGNFYDFHALSFVPFFFFWVYYLWVVKKDRPIFGLTSFMLLLLLSIKQDLALSMLMVGVYLGVSESKQAWAYFGISGCLAYLFFTQLVIPHYGGDPYFFSYYFSGMIPWGGGPRDLAETFLVAPLFSLKQALTSPKLLFLFQTCAQTAGIVLLRPRTWILMAYGLACSLAASRPYVFQLGFQYVFQFIPFVFVAHLEVLRTLPKAFERWQVGRGNVLLAGALLLSVDVFHYGMIYPAHNFVAAGRTIDFKFSTREQTVYADLIQAAKKIPGAASVAADSTIVPHVAERTTVYELEDPRAVKADVFLTFAGRNTSYSRVSLS